MQNAQESKQLSQYTSHCMQIKGEFNFIAVQNYVVPAYRS